MAAPGAPAGRFISFEGIDGSGKSTQARRLVAALREAGHEVTHTREPGGAPGAEVIRELVLTGAQDRWSPETEILLFTAARRDHLERTIRPALAEGKLVICDRFADSTRVYQGLTRGDLTAKVDALHELMIGMEPDMTILLDADPATSLARGIQRGGELRFEGFGLEMQERARAGFLSLAAAAPERFRVIDAGRSEDEVAGDILDAAQAVL
ncbi:dTMP kinase [Pseudoroseicyclus tamaricis]|uniref:Thymidylate kinase n=1 Tax=Pseudoroseicyclus tamaricis TaxID=2705421 RepID=A0A6B2JFX4_9RHOB|nr:dTMP kinase [Pseudoroseicyclus tamaricis]NDU99992.1 dTMP kinase [Pseudoroseicyclus tamaricis]